MIKVIERSEEDNDGCAHYELEIKQDDKKLLSFSAGPLCECPEDAILERDLSYVYDVVEAFKLGFAAGKQGEIVEYINEEMGD